MNERIRELHRQVMLWNDTNDCPYDGEFNVPQEYTQKLAELILTEVIFTIKRIATLNECDFVGVMIADSVKEQFEGE